MLEDLLVSTPKPDLHGIISEVCVVLKALNIRICIHNKVVCYTKDSVYLRTNVLMYGNI